MGDFFHGWRRKTGIVALVMACVLMAGWVRSHSVHDEFVVPTGKRSAIQILSACRCVGFVAIHMKGTQRDMIPFSWQSKPCQGNRINLQIETTTQNVQAVIEGDDFQLVNSGFGTSRLSAEYYHIPHWWLSIPLTLLSAYLLLGKPRKDLGI